MSPMKKLFVVLTLVLVVCSVRAALPQPDLIAQIHFAGAQKISADKNSSAFTNEFCSAEALALRQQVADKLALWLAGWLHGKLGVSVPGGAVKLRPLFDDLQTAEWFAESRAAAGNRPDVAIAIKLSAARAKLWQANLKAFFPSATFRSSNGWLIFDSGTGAQKLGGVLARKISEPSSGWLNLDVNWPCLAQWFPKLKELELPETAFAVTAAAGNFHINGKFFYPNKLSLSLKPWQFPTNLVHQPLVSFTAVRGISHWLNSQPWAADFRLSPEPDELYVWALNGPPFQTFAAAPVPNAPVALRQLYTELQPVVAERSSHEGFITPFSLELTNNDMRLRGTPFVSLYVQAAKELAGQFLFAGAFPNLPHSRPLPPELFQGLAAPNLVFYHWEITAERMMSQLQMSQIALVLTRHKQLDGRSAAFKWAFAVGKKLGNTVTEIKQTAPDQLTFTRKAPGGLTAFEFIALANWIDAPDFPHCNLNLPPVPERIKKMLMKHHHPAPPGASGP